LGSEGEGPLRSCAGSGCLEGDDIHVFLTRWRSWQRAKSCVTGGKTNKVVEFQGDMHLVMLN
jgi:hypothetical protein